MSLAEYIYTHTRTALEGIPTNERDGIYVASLFVYDEEDEPLRPTITVGFNTERQVAESNESGVPEDEAEARWNYAFYLQNELAVICDTERDSGGAAARRAWIRDSGFEKGADDLEETLTPAFVELVVQVARRLHDDGDIERIFGREIPVLIHELEYHDTIADQNARANPPGVADDFIVWCRGLG